MIKIQHDFQLSYVENAVFRLLFQQKELAQNKIKFLHLLHCLGRWLAAVVAYKFAQEKVLEKEMCTMNGRRMFSGMHLLSFILHRCQIAINSS